MACLWVLIAASVSGGTPAALTHSSGWPDLAAQPAAGIAYSGRSEEATTTTPAGSPAAAACSRSTAAASAAGLAAVTSVVL